jgi:hypothetical protein
MDRYGFVVTDHQTLLRVNLDHDELVDDSIHRNDPDPVTLAKQFAAQDPHLKGVGRRVDRPERRASGNPEDDCRQ